MELGKIAVVGAGAMGNGISQACAVAGLDVVMTDVAPAQLERALSTIGSSLDSQISSSSTPPGSSSGGGGGGSSGGGGGGGGGGGR